MFYPFYCCKHDNGGMLAINYQQVFSWYGLSKQDTKTIWKFI